MNTNRIRLRMVAVRWSLYARRFFCLLGLLLTAGFVFAQTTPEKQTAPSSSRPRPRQVEFSGHQWRVKSSSSRRVGPGPNHFSAAPENVWVDGQGRLHLKITRQDDRWLCAEIVSEKSFGFGTYRFYLNTPVGHLDPMVVLGLFTWSDRRDYAHREIDVEWARWGNAADTNNAKFVVQPYGKSPDHIRRFRVPPDLEHSTCSFSWQQDRVAFLAVAGHSRAVSATNVLIQSWMFSKEDVPQPGDENVRLNLWLMDGRPPKDGREIEVVIDRFEFEPVANPVKGGS